MDEKVRREDKIFSFERPNHTLIGETLFYLVIVFFDLRIFG